VRRYASGLSCHPVAAHAVGETAGEILEQLDGDDPDLVVCFASPHFVGTFDDATHALRELLHPQVLIGATAGGIVGGAHEVEQGPAVSVFAACLPDATLTPVELALEDTPDGAAVAGWPPGIDAPTTLVLLADPFSFPADGFLRRLNEDRPGLTVIGGMASAATNPGGNRLVLDDDVRRDGAVGVVLDGVDVTAVVSQGCRPVGQAFTVTRADRNLVIELGGQPALQRLQELAAAADEAERDLLRQGLSVGLVVDEHQADFARGDFLVRNVLGADPDGGAVAVGDHVEVGQTLQFQVRDGSAADEDLRALLGPHRAAGALLFTCNGRGSHLFGVPDHDAGMLAELLGPVPVAGAFCAGELGPIGGRNFLHGFTASVALFD
jgi:small ligand-binding sensory domain FIST